MAFGKDGRYYAEAKLPKAARDKLDERNKPVEEKRPVRFEKPADEHVEAAHKAEPLKK